MKKLLLLLAIVLSLFFLITTRTSAQTVTGDYSIPDSSNSTPATDTSGTSGYYSESNTITTIFGNGNNSNNGQSSNSSSQLADVANALVQAVQQYCGGSISSSNVSCISAHMPSMPYPETAYNEILTSANTYTYLQCVGLAQAIISGVYGQNLGYGVGSAKDYATNVPAGYTFIPNSGTIQAGDIPIWGAHAGDPDGHIAIAVSTIGSDSFAAAEANIDFQGKVTTRVHSTSEVLGWLRKQ